MDRKRSGEFGEALACRYLEGLGYLCLEKNYRAQGSEVDLIMQDGDTLVFVEVKARSGGRFGLGREAVTPNKQQRIIRGALAYLQAHGRLEGFSRFDVVEIDLITREATHIPNAFTL